MNKASTFSTLEIGSVSVTQGTLIWFHGLGASNQDFKDLASQLEIPQLRIVLPQAPIRSVSLNYGFKMPAWYDVFGLSLDTKQDYAGIKQAYEQVVTLLDIEQARGRKPEHIILGGFSLGAALALHSALRYHHQLAGAIVLSGYLPIADTIEEQASKVNKKLPIFMGHGKKDTVVQPILADHSLNFLTKLGYQVDFRYYESLGHSVNGEELEAIKNSLKSMLFL